MDMSKIKFISNNVTYFFKFSFRTFLNFDYIIIVFLIFNFFTWLHFVVNISREMCEFLDINMFSQKKGLKSVEIK